MTYLSIFPAMGHSSCSANCLQVSLSIVWVSGRSVKVATFEEELEALHPINGAHLLEAVKHTARPSIEDILSCYYFDYINMINSKIWKTFKNFETFLPSQFNKLTVTKQSQNDNEMLMFFFEMDFRICATRPLCTRPPIWTRIGRTQKRTTEPIHRYTGGSESEHRNESSEMWKIRVPKLLRVG